MKRAVTTEECVFVCVCVWRENSAACPSSSLSFCSLLSLMIFLSTDSGSIGSICLQGPVISAISQDISSLAYELFLTLKLDHISFKAFHAFVKELLFRNILKLSRQLGKGNKISRLYYVCQQFPFPNFTMTELHYRIGFS